MLSAKYGQRIWTDLTVANADALRDFYQNVVGWTPQPFDTDYNMLDSDGEAAVGICHKRGVNAAMPSQWMVYFAVANLDDSLIACTQAGGKVVVPPRGEPGQRFAVIEDPAGAVCALMEQASA